MKRIKKIALTVIMAFVLLCAMPLGVSASNCCSNCYNRLLYFYANGYNNIGSAIGQNTFINPKDYLQSSNGAFLAVMQEDGGFVIYNRQGPIWMTNTFYGSFMGAYITFQTDGNLVMYSRPFGNVLWSPYIQGKGATRLTMQNDGNLVAHDGKGTVIWQSGTAGAKACCC